MTRQDWKSKVRRNLSILLVIAILSSLLAGSSVLAEEPEPTTLESTVGALGWGEEGIKEVGIEWINDFPGTSGDRSHWDESCDRFYNKLRGDGWSKAFRWTDWNAWEIDFKDESRGGQEDSVADTADIAMLCTHGSGTWDDFWSQNLSSVYFGSTVDDRHLVPGDAYLAYGDQDLEWLCFDSCSVLSEGGPAPYRNRGYWAATMDGLHLLLGFKNTMYVISTGDGSKWADYMLGWRMWFPFVGWVWLRPPYKITQAWFEAVDDLQPSGVCARVLAEVNDNYNDYLHGKGYVSPDPTHDNQHWYWDHCSGTPPPLQLEEEVLADIETLPVYEVVDREVDEEYVLDIASAFEMTGTVEDIGTDGEYYYMLNTTGVETHTLQVDIASGGYKYREASELWVSPVDPPALPLADEAMLIGDEFFTGPGEGLPGAAYRTGDPEVTTEEQVEVEAAATESGILQEQELSRIPVNLSLSYVRTITAAVGLRTASGLRRQAQEISLVGPGARTKMYLGDMGEILGVQGGSRDIQTTGEEVTIMDADKVWGMFLEDPTIALAQIPWVADEITKTAETLGYYEHPQLQGQAELIPAWIFTADFYAAGELLAGDVLVYAPAAADYLPPEVSIEAPTAGAEFKSGELVTFDGSVVQYGKPPFTYEWYSSHDGFLGGGANIAARLTTQIREGKIVSHTISLQVADANGQHGAASERVFVKAAVYLPVILKGW